MVFSTILTVCLFQAILSTDIEISSNAAAAINQRPDGHKQTYMSTESKAKSYNNSGSVVAQNVKLPYATEAPNPNILPEDGIILEKGFQKKTESWCYVCGDGKVELNDWWKIWPGCASNLRSPINIDTQETNKSASHLVKPLKWFSDKQEASYKPLDNEYLIGMEFRDNYPYVKVTEGVFFESVFKLTDILIHLDCHDSLSSEHTIDGDKYDGEIQFLFKNINTERGTLTVPDYDSYGMISYFIKKSDKESDISKLVKISKDIPGDEHHSFKAINFTDVFPFLFAKSEQDNYFAYRGSFTTPPCSKPVSVIVHNKPLRGTKQDFEDLKNSMNPKHVVCDNFRPTQPLHGRHVYHIVRKQEL